MHWKTKRQSTRSPRVGSRTVRVIFALLPKKCTDGTTRWLEKVVEVQEYSKWEECEEFDMGPRYIDREGWRVIEYRSLETPTEIGRIPPSVRDHYDPSYKDEERTGNRRWNGGTECDTDDGPCSCGAWHSTKELRVMKFPIWKDTK